MLSTHNESRLAACPPSGVPRRKLGCRRGEVLALRWCDIRDNTAFVDRSLCQTKDGLIFKAKTQVPRKIALPPTMPEVIETHRLRQAEFHRQFGPDYRADLDLVFNPDGTPLLPKFDLRNCVAGLPALGAAQGCIATRCATPTRACYSKRARGSRPSPSAWATPRCARPPTSTATRSAARTARSPRCGTRLCNPLGRRANPKW